MAKNKRVPSPYLELCVSALASLTELNQSLSTMIADTSPDQSQAVALPSASVVALVAKNLDTVVSNIQKGSSLLQEAVEICTKAIEQLPDPKQRLKEGKALLDNPNYQLACQTIASGNEAISKLSEVMLEQLKLQSNLSSAPCAVTESSPLSQGSTLMAGSTDMGLHLTDDASISSVVLEGKTGVTDSPLSVFLAAISATKTQAGVWSITGAKGEFPMLDHRHAIQVVQMLETMTIDTGQTSTDSASTAIKVTDRFNISIKTRSLYSVKTNPYARGTFTALAWVTDSASVLKVDIDLARRQLSQLNGYWFPDPRDIESIDFYGLPHTEKLIMNLFISKRSYERFITSVVQRKSITTNNEPLEVHLELRVDACYNCLLFGHRASSGCTVVRCKFCTQSHRMTDCPIRLTKDKWQCFRCLEHNSRSPVIYATNHHALAPHCPLVRRRKEHLISEQREAILRRSLPTIQRAHAASSAISDLAPTQERLPANGTAEAPQEPMLH